MSWLFDQWWFWLVLGVLIVPYFIHPFMRWFDTKVLKADYRNSSHTQDDQDGFQGCTYLPVINVIMCFYYFVHLFGLLDYLTSRRAVREKTADLFRSET